MCNIRMNDAATRINKLQKDATKSVVRMQHEKETKKDRYVIACKGWRTENHTRLMNTPAKGAVKVHGEEFATEGAMVGGMAKSPNVD